MPWRHFLSIVLLLACTFTVAAQEAADHRKQLFADLNAMEKIARDRVFDAAEWKKFDKLEETASELIHQAEQKQAELDQSGKAELYRLFVRASRLEAAEKSKTLTPDDAVEKINIEKEILRLSEPLLLARLKELSAKKEAGEELSLRETAIFDGLTRWRAAKENASAADQPTDELNAPRMDVRELIWTEQIGIMETQNLVRRDLRLKDQLAEIYRWLTRRAEGQEGESREDAIKRIAALKAKRQ